MCVKDPYSDDYNARALARFQTVQPDHDWKPSDVPLPFILAHYPTLFIGIREQFRKQSLAETYIARLALWYLDDLSSVCRRLLDFKEFIHAVTLWADGLPLGLNHQDYQQRILKACCGLLRPATDKTALEWAHWTIGIFHRKENKFLDQILDYSEKRMFSPTTALKLLASNILASGPCSDGDIENRLSDFPLLEYASLYWGWSPKSPDTEDWSVILCHSALEFLLNDAKRRASLQVVVYLNSKRGKELKDTPLFGISIDSSPLHLAAAFGLQRIVAHLISKNYDPSSKDTNGNTPLSLANRTCSRAQNSRREQALINTLELMKSSSNPQRPRGRLFARRSARVGEADHLTIPDLDVVGEGLTGVWSRGHGELPSSLSYDRHLRPTPTLEEIERWKMRNSS